MHQFVKYVCHFSYLEKYADLNDEPTSAQYDQSFEDMDLSVDKWRGENFVVFVT